MTRFEHPSDLELDAYVLNKLGEDRTAEIEEHYLLCTLCQNRLLEIDASVEAVNLLKDESSVAALQFSESCARSQGREAISLRRLTLPRVLSTSCMAATAAAAFFTLGFFTASHFAGSPVGGSGLHHTQTSSALAAAAFPCIPSAGVPVLSPVSLRPRALRAAHKKRLKRSERNATVRMANFVPPAHAVPIWQEPRLAPQPDILLADDVDDPLQFDPIPDGPAPKTGIFRRVITSVARAVVFMFRDPEETTGTADRTRSAVLWR